MAMAPSGSSATLYAGVCDPADPTAGIRPDAAGIVLLFGTPADVRRAAAWPSAPKPDTAVLAVATAGLAIDRPPPAGIFVDVTGDLWFCTDIVGSERIQIPEKHYD